MIYSTCWMFLSTRQPSGSCRKKRGALLFTGILLQSFQDPQLSSGSDTDHESVTFTLVFRQTYPSIEDEDLSPIQFGPCRYICSGLRSLMDHHHHQNPMGGPPRSFPSAYPRSFPIGHHHHQLGPAAVAAAAAAAASSLFPSPLHGKSTFCWMIHRFIPKVDAMKFE